MRRLADVAHDRPRRVLVLAALAFLVAAAFGLGTADRLKPYGADDPDTDSVIATEQIEAATGAQAIPGFVAVVRNADAARIARVTRAIRAHEEVRFVDRGGRSRDGRSIYLLTRFRPLEDRVLQDAAKDMADELDRIPGVFAGGWTLGNQEANETVERDIVRAELFAFPLLLILSFLFFRSLVAASLPLLVGALAIVATFFTLRLASEATDVSVYALNITTGLGLGLAIDYSLFIVSRYREELACVGPGREALRRTMATAGRTVVFSSLTVAAATASLLIFPQRFLYSMGIGATSVALLAAVVSLLVLPAVLALLGPRVNALAPRRLQRAAASDARVAESGGWYRLSRAVLRRPGRVALVAAAILVIAGLPFLRIAFTWLDTDVLPADARARQTQEVLDRDFSAQATNPVTLAISAPKDGRAVRRVVEQVRELPGAAAVRPPRAAGSELTVVDVVARGDVLTDDSQDLVRAVRRLDAGVDVRVAGVSASFVDLKSSLAHHIPIALALVAITTLIVLFLMTGSVVLPLKALVMNALTISATFGMLVVIFQDGRFESLLGFSSPGGLELTVPVLLFALVFGLSTDYGVFLLSRIKEARDAGAPDIVAVATGIERTGRIVTAAALLFAIAFGSFVTSEVTFVKETGVGTAFAVLIDATLVRAFLVPALMGLMGRWNWWAPGPLRALHRRFGVREEPAATVGA